MNKHNHKYLQSQKYSQYNIHEYLQSRAARGKALKPADVALNCELKEETSKVHYIVYWP